MKSFASVFFLWVFTAGMLHNTAMYLNFFVNQSEIVELFCINKEEPEIQCNGTCHLKKQMTPADKDAQPTPPEVRFEWVHVLILENEEVPMANVWTIGEKHLLFNTCLSEDADLEHQTPPPRCV